MVSSSSLFRKVTELGKFVWSSGILHTSWSKILESNNQNQDSSALGFKIHEHGKLTIVVFTAPRVTDNESALTLLSLSQAQNPFSFLCSEKISKFSVHTGAFRLFSSAYTALSLLKSELLNLLKSEESKPVIITGAGLGGSVATLFTLWLLEIIDPKKQRLPLCITFGSPLIGDSSLQQILEGSLRNLCFLHVAQPETRSEAGFKPFGQFLFCFESECICIEDPVAVTELLTGAKVDLGDYGEVLDRLDQSVLSIADSRLRIDGVIDGMEKRVEAKKVSYDQSKKLKDIKIAMIYIEWYKKMSKKAKNGYYDQYRFDIPTEVNMNIEKLKKELNEYWKSLVEDEKKKPRSDMGRRFVLAANNYRRMIEPLDIAEYYRTGQTEYVKRRHPHYVMLEKWFEQWFKDQAVQTKRLETSDLSDLLTFDSCFWAKVEEAKIVLNSLKTHEGMSDEISMNKLVAFEEYVWRLIKKREVSPEIFLEKSSFMEWWNGYKKIKESHESNSPPSDFTEFMINKKYHTYGQPA